MKDIEKVKQAIEKGEYRKKVLAEILGIAPPTIRTFLEKHPDIEELRLKNQPLIAEKGRKDYVKEYNKKYERPITDERKEWVREYERKRRAKRKAEKEAEKILLVPPEKVKVGKVDKTGFSDSIAPNQIILKL